MRSVAPMRTAKIGYIVVSALLIALGAALLIWPEVSAAWIGRLLGIGMIAFGAIKLVGYFSRDLFRLAFQYDLAFGLLLIALGAVTLAHPSDAMSFLCVLASRCWPMDCSRFRSRWIPGGLASGAGGWCWRWQFSPAPSGWCWCSARQPASRCW